MNIKLTEIGREVGGRAFTRGLLLLVVFICICAPALSQSLGVGTELPPDIAERLRRELAGSTEQKRSALFEIRNLRSPSASSLAVRALADKDELIRATAAASVVFLPKADAARVLMPLLSDKAEFVRREAAFALGVAGDESASAQLVRLMQTDKILEVRTAAAVALGNAGDLPAVDGLSKILRARPREEDEFLRRSAARSIGQIAQRRVSAEPQTVTPQNFLPEKFKELGPQNVPAPAGFESAVTLLIVVLRNASESDDTRREAAFALGAIGDPKALTALQSYTTAADPYMAEIAREAVLNIERRNKVPASND